MCGRYTCAYVHIVHVYMKNIGKLRVFIINPDSFFEYIYA